jgi:hypothetical protein
MGSWGAAFVRASTTPAFALVEAFAMGARNAATRTARVSNCNVSEVFGNGCDAVGVASYR